MLGDINARPAHVSWREASLRASLFFYGCVFCGFYSRPVHKPMGKFRTGISGTGAYGIVVLVPMRLSRNISSRIYRAQNQKKLWHAVIYLGQCVWLAVTLWWGKIKGIGESHTDNTAWYVNWKLGENSGRAGASNNFYRLDRMIILC